MAKKYKTKTQTARALQWTGLNANEAQAFCPKLIVMPNKSGPKKGMWEAQLETRIGIMDVNIGDWMVEVSHGDFFVFDLETFKNTYEVA